MEGRREIPLPREVWTLILRELSDVLTFEQRHYGRLINYDDYDPMDLYVPLTTVCSAWRAIVYALVTKLFGSWQLSDEALQRFHALRCLKVQGDQFRMSRKSKITDVGIKKLPLLVSLELFDNALIPDAAILSLPNLTSLGLVFGSKVTDQAVKQLTQLRRLNLRENRNITNDAITALSNLTSLHLTYNPNITDTALACLTLLNRLDLQNNAIITNYSVSRLTNLTALVLSGTLTRGTYNMHVSNRAVSCLTNLTALDLSHYKHVTDDGVKPLTALRTLILDGNSLITDAGITEMMQLTCLGMAGARASPFTFNGLKNLINLRTLYLGEDANRSMVNTTIIKLQCLQEGGSPVFFLPFRTVERKTNFQFVIYRLAVMFVLEVFLVCMEIK
jgi:hypothetical protein